MSQNQKAPKVIIVEVCQKRKIDLSWSTSTVQVAPAPIFKVQCTVGTTGEEEITAEGHGSSKKEAEKCASYKMLPKLLGVEELLQLTDGDYRDTLAEEKKVLATRVKDKDPSVNAASTDEDSVSDTDDDLAQPLQIGELNTLTAHCNLPSVEYKEGPQKAGPNNFPIFTITASVGDISTQTGKRYKKQHAKTIAAYRVLRDLKEKGYKTKGKKGKEPSTPLPSPRNVSNEVSSTQSPEEQAKYSNIVVDGNFSSKETATLPKRNIRALPAGPEESAEEKGELDPPLMETGDQDLRILKRKMEEEEEEPDVLSSSSSISKRKFELLYGEKLTCFRKSPNCLRFVKDFAHIFQHLPSNRNLDEALERKEFHRFLPEHGGPLKLLEKSATQLNIRIKFSKKLYLLNTDSTLVMLVLEFQNIEEFRTDSNILKRHTFSGVGKDFEAAKEDAALNALKYLRQMMFVDFDD